MSKIVAMSIEEWQELAESSIDISVRIQLAGVSMEPLVRKNRDFVTIRPLYREPKVGDIVLFHRSDDAYVVHRVQKIFRDKVQTLGDGCVRSDCPLAFEDVLGIVTKVERGRLTLNTDTKRARFYGRMRMSTRSARWFAGAVKGKLKRMLQASRRKD